MDHNGPVLPLASGDRPGWAWPSSAVSSNSRRRTSGSSDWLPTSVLTSICLPAETSAYEVITKSCEASPEARVSLRISARWLQDRLSPGLRAGRTEPVDGLLREPLLREPGQETRGPAHSGARPRRGSRTLQIAYAMGTAACMYFGASKAGPQVTHSSTGYATKTTGYTTKRTCKCARRRERSRSAGPG